MKKLELLDCWGGGGLGEAATSKNNLLFPEMLCIELPFEPTIPFLGIYSNWKHVHPKIVKLFMLAIITQIFITWWMGKQKWFIHTTGYYLLIKRNEVVIHVTTWMKLESMCQVEEARHTLASHWHEVSRTGNPVRIERRCMVSVGLLLMCRGFLLGDENVLELGSSGCTAMRMT